MSDEETRELERRWQETQSREDGAAYYRQVARSVPQGCPLCGHEGTLQEIRTYVGLSDHGDPQLDQLPPWPLSDLVFCAACGSSYVAHAAKKVVNLLSVIVPVEQPIQIVEHVMVRDARFTVTEVVPRGLTGQVVATWEVVQASSSVMLAPNERTELCNLVVETQGPNATVRLQFVTHVQGSGLVEVGPRDGAILAAQDWTQGEGDTVILEDLVTLEDPYETLVVWITDTGAWPVTALLQEDEEEDERGYWETDETHSCETCGGCGHVVFSGSGTRLPCHGYSCPGDGSCPSCGGE